MTYSYYLKEKQNIQDTLEKVLYEVFSNMTIEELKKISWFTMEGWNHEHPERREQHR